MRECELALQRALQALAQPPEIQIALFPAFVAVADELVLDFDQVLYQARSEVGSTWSESQLKALQVLDLEIEKYSGPARPEIWEAPDCLSHPTWSTFRTLAAEALSAFNWAKQIPPPSKAIYVRQPRA